MRPVAGHVSVEVVEQVRHAPSRELAVGIVCCRADRIRQPRPREAPAHAVSPSGVVVGKRRSDWWSNTISYRRH